ncbi:hypothetical protein PJP10_31240, partial [Mycobacterium kansasii]
QKDLDKTLESNTYLNNDLQLYYSDNDKLERINLSLKTESSELTKQIELLEDENRHLKNENHTLRFDLERSRKCAEINYKFAQSGEKLEKMLGIGRPGKDKSGLGYEKIKRKTGNAPSVIEKSTGSSSIMRTSLVCHLCGDLGHY